MAPSSSELYTPREIARASGVELRQVSHVLATLGFPETGVLVPHDQAVRVGRMLRGRDHPVRRPIFAAIGERSDRPRLVPLALSSTFHAGLAATLILIASLNLAPRAATLADDRPAAPIRMVFLQSPGPGGGGGGGGLMQKPAPPKAMREGTRRITSPLPDRREPKPIVPVATPPEPKPAPPLKAEQLPVVVAPIITAPADSRTRIGVLEQTVADNDSRGSGKGGGVGSGSGTGLGSGDGSGIGPGSGGGTGGGPYRPGSGIQAPRLLREVKAEYTEEARQRSVAGEVILEIVVRRDGSVGDVRILRGLGAGLNERAVQAVRQWRFAPAERLGSPVDVIVEVSVEFKLR